MSPSATFLADEVLLVSAADVVPPDAVTAVEVVEHSHAELVTFPVVRLAPTVLAGAPVSETEGPRPTGATGAGPNPLSASHLSATGPDEFNICWQTRGTVVRRVQMEVG